MRGIAMKYYTVYREDTEEIIAFGNAVQCAEILGLKYSVPEAKRKRV